MVEPLVIPRAEHTISRRHVDPDALKVLYRLRKFDHIAYLVGGSVRDLLLDRHPKDFDIGTSAHPHEVKRLFRNCWIIGRRFRLAHVKFGPKTIEVATFRRQVPLDAAPATPKVAEPGTAGASTAPPTQGGQIRRDNTFGTAEEDAFRRDFTINALFYDIATFSVIDYVGGVTDLRDGIIRSIGDPNERFIEDPVRMLRAISFTARLGFRLDDRVRRAIAKHKAVIAQAAPARVIEELYKVLRSGVSAATFRSLSKTGLLKQLAPEVDKFAAEALWRSLRALDDYRIRSKDASPTLTNPILLGSLILPVQPLDLTRYRKDDPRAKGAGVSLGDLPVARKDVERLRELLRLQDQLTSIDPPPRVQRAVTRRGAFEDAMTWLEITEVMRNRWRDGRPSLRQERVRPPQRPSGDGGERSPSAPDCRHRASHPRPVYCASSSPVTLTNDSTMPTTVRTINPKEVIITAWLSRRSSMNPIR